MKETVLPVSGNLRSQRIQIMKSLYEKLLSKEWKSQKIWEHLRDKNLTAVPCFLGNKYYQSDTKIMIVGRAVNGWQIDFNDCSSLEKTIDSVLYQTNRLDDFAKDYTIDEVTQEKYYYAKSSFLRMMRGLVKKFTGNDENWQQKMVWSNLYKVAPRNTGNPSWLMLRNDIPVYIDIIKNEILDYRPDIVIFVTDMDFFDPYPNHKKYASFKELIATGSELTDLKENICLAGKFSKDPDITMIVCKRPEFRSVEQLVNNIYETYNNF